MSGSAKYINQRWASAVLLMFVIAILQLDGRTSTTFEEMLICISTYLQLEFFQQSATSRFQLLKEILLRNCIISKLSQAMAEVRTKKKNCGIATADLQSWTSVTSSTVSQ